MVSFFFFFFFFVSGLHKVLSQLHIRCYAGYCINTSTLGSSVCVYIQIDTHYLHLRPSKLFVGKAKCRLSGSCVDFDRNKAILARAYLYDIDVSLPFLNVLNQC